ncbi:AsnC family transcriptional regulator [Niabella ginsenosidivorans]|uniref:AsnC family transcriptional regulator n=1 Tax=Niabella ginsenosidivorans TaxID=1176587 RepID=A0A1A9I647_9BACT|nr:Lrp/AsnC family transcriptional regulator [Niabella ginsenosidivorans]ANH82132.1 AsnC family transcriptional regulator [Niabella ginsenosidivorans]
MPKSKIPKAENAAGILLDPKDLAILKLLQDNARIAVKDIAAKIHLSPTPVHERIKRLEESGIIRQYATLLDPQKLNKGLMVICYVSLRQHDKKAGLRFIQAINGLNEVVECYSISGEFDFMLKVLAKDMAGFYDFHVNRLSQVENLGHVQSIFVMGVVKETHLLL